jgi:pimeloyl-ACP methyl ester carboxylesterase
VNVYFISGLGADQRVFCNIQLPIGFTAHHLEWIKAKSHESLPQYAVRLAENIDKSKPFVLVGLSMGGMIAVEIARKYAPICIILISSVSSSKQLPPYYRWAGRLKLHKLVPVGFFLKASLLKRFFTTESREDKQMLKSMIRRADPYFIKWSMNAVLKWEAEEVPSEVIHIHGTGDLILPCRFTHPQYKIKGAGHLMVVNRAAEINKILEDVLSRYSSH